MDRYTTDWYTKVLKTKHRKPTGPGEILHLEFLKPLSLTQKKLADHIGCDIKMINRIVNGRAPISVDMAVRLGAALGTTPEFWLNAQLAVDLFHAVEETDRPLPVKIF